MALRITREVPLGPGSKSFRFENQKDAAEDQRKYEEGITLEQARFREGTLAQKIYDRLSDKKAA